MLTEIVSRSFHYTALYYEKGRSAEYSETFVKYTALKKQ